MDLYPPIWLPGQDTSGPFLVELSSRDVFNERLAPVWWRSIFLVPLGVK